MTTSMALGRELPILFSTPMVQAILGDLKFLTRRVLKIQPDKDCYYEMKPITLEYGRIAVMIDYNQGDDNPIVVAPWQPGDILWVRESWAPGGFITSGPGVIFRDPHMEGLTKWKPSIHMRKEHARIWLKVESVKFESLQDITPEDAIREGYPPGYYPVRDKDESKYVKWFHELWDKINGENSWDENPYVWRYAFKVLSKTGRPENI